MHFQKTQSQFDHGKGRIVNYNDTVVAIAGGRLEGYDMQDFFSHAKVEQLGGQKWSEHDMSPVNGLDSLVAFTALSIGSNLFIFGNYNKFFEIKGHTDCTLGGLQNFWNFDSVLKWDGQSWSSSEHKMYARRFSHTTIVYSGEIYHIGGCNSAWRCGDFSSYSIEKWSETYGSELVYEDSDENTGIYVAPICWPIEFQNMNNTTQE